MAHVADSFIPARPAGQPAVWMRWENLLFAHWPVPVAAVRAMTPRIPPQLEIDTFDGSAWIGLIPFSMRFRRLGLPPVPTMRRFHECNVRTYVTLDGQPGVWFFSLDAASALAAWGARRFWNLPYHHARMRVRREADRVDYEVERRAKRGAKSGVKSNAILRCSWRAGPPLPPTKPGELAYFLTERYMLYAADRLGRLHRGRIWHEPWPLRTAELCHCDDGLIRAAGFVVDSDAQPVLHHADQLDVQAWPLEPVANLSPA